MKQKLLLIGYRAYGDWVYTAPVLPLLLEEYEIHFEMNRKGHELFHNDPRFASKSVFEFEKYPPEDVERICKERWAHLEKTLKPDKVINLWRTLETECIAEDYQPIFYESVEKRREHFGKKNFYEAVFDRCGISIPENLNLEGFYYTPEEIAWAERWRESHRDNFLVMIPVSGTCIHKVHVDMPQLVFDILDCYEDAIVYLTGDASADCSSLKHPRIRLATGNAPIKQIFLMTKYADMVIGPETGVLVAAGMWGTPKIMFCTASSVYQTCKYHRNDFSMQAPVACSPCHRSIYGYQDCHGLITEESGYKYPACIDSQPYHKVLETISYVYDNLRSGLLRTV